MLSRLLYKWFKSKFFAKICYAVGFTAAIISATYATIVHRPMMYDGSAWYFAIFTRLRFYDPTFTRYFTLVLEWPATFLLKYYPNLDIKTIIAVLDFSLAFHPLVSLYCCYLILKNKNRMELLIFPVLSYATATLSTLAFGVGVVPESLTLFWPLLFVMQFRDSISWKENTWCIVLTVALTFTYELSVILFGVLFLVQFLRYRKNPKISEIVFLLLPLLGATYCAYRILGPTSGHQSLFWLSVQSPFQTFRKYSVCMIIGFFALLWSLQKHNKTPLPKLIFSFSILAALSCWITFILGYFQLGTSHHSRVTAIPMAALIALGYVIFYHSNLDSDKIKRLLSGLPVLFVNFVLLSSSIYDFHYSYKWNFATKEVFRVYKDSKGCYQDPNPEINLMTWQTPYISIFLQESRKIKWIVFSPTEPNGRCKTFSEGYIDDGFSDHRVANHWYFDFSEALSETKKTEALKQK